MTEKELVLVIPARLAEARAKRAKAGIHKVK